MPTFIASFYGANTDLPGKEHWTGFWQMVLMMVCATPVAIVLLQRSRRRSAQGRSSRSKGDSAS